MTQYRNVGSRNSHIDKHSLETGAHTLGVNHMSWGNLELLVMFG